jgi:hypothetical protein
MKTNRNKTSDPGSIDAASEHTLQTIARHQRRLKWLTGAAIAFWALAVVGSIGVLVSYTQIIAPKERQIMADFGTGGRFAAPQIPESEVHANRVAGINFTMTYVITKGILIVAISVAVLSLGTLATLVLTISSRRVTLQQINHSLAQISDQLRELKSTSNQ